MKSESKESKSEPKATVRVNDFVRNEEGLGYRSIGRERRESGKREAQVRKVSEGEKDFVIFKQTLHFSSSLLHASLHFQHSLWLSLVGRTWSSFYHEPSILFPPKKRKKKISDLFFWGLYHKSESFVLDYLLFVWHLTRPPERLQRLLLLLCFLLPFIKDFKQFVSSQTECCLLVDVIQFHYYVLYLKIFEGEKKMVSTLFANAFFVSQE